jgi:hypothetical protein
MILSEEKNYYQHSDADEEFDGDILKAIEP